MKPTGLIICSSCNRHVPVTQCSVDHKRLRGRASKKMYVCCDCNPKLFEIQENARTLLEEQRRNIMPFIHRYAQIKGYLRLGDLATFKIPVNHRYPMMAMLIQAGYFKPQRKGRYLPIERNPDEHC